MSCRGIQKCILSLNGRLLRMNLNKNNNNVQLLISHKDCLTIFNIVLDIHITRNLHTSGKLANKNVPKLKKHCNVIYTLRL